MNLRLSIGFLGLGVAALLAAGCRHHPHPSPSSPAMRQNASAATSLPTSAPRTMSKAATTRPAVLRPATKFVRVKKLADGLIIQDIKIGTGAKPQPGKQVVVNYTGWLPNGKIFDATRLHGNQPFMFVYDRGQVIPGWDKGLAGMRVGGIRQLVIPPKLAYGAQGVPPTIPPKATLIFRIHLLAIINNTAGPAGGE